MEKLTELSKTMHSIQLILAFSMDQEIQFMEVNLLLVMVEAI